MLISTTLLLCALAAPPSFPDWARTARLAGASFELELSDGQIAAKLDRLAQAGVSVVVADAPTGWSYTDWVDPQRFAAVLDLMRNRVIPRAHAKGLRLVWYLTALELISVNGRNNGRDPALEFPSWLQLDRHGDPVAYTGRNGAFWLGKNDIDVWVGPESPYRSFFLDRVRACAASGADGLWFDVAYYPNSLGRHDDLWPSYDSYTAAAFQTAYGISPIPARDFEDPAFRRFVRFRQESIAAFARETSAAARQVDPLITIFFENWSLDWLGATTYGQDALDLLADPTLATAHELSPVDQDRTGMRRASLNNWRDYVGMVKFSVESNPNRPGWILSYAGSKSDSLRQAGVQVAEGANFYEAQGPEMVDDSTGSRKAVFAWIEGNQEFIYGSESLADVAVYYSARTRDFVDQDHGGDSAFQLGPSSFYREYRLQTRKLLKRQVSFDLLTPESLEPGDTSRYNWLLLPAVQCLSDAEAAWIRGFEQAGGKVAHTLASGSLDEWGQPRAQNALAGVVAHDPAEIESDRFQVLTNKNTRKRLLVEIRSGSNTGSPFLTATLVNLKAGRLRQIPLEIRMPSGLVPSSVRLTAPDQPDRALDFTLNAGLLRFTIPKLKTAALVIAEPGP